MADDEPTQEQLRGWFPKQRETPPNTFEIGLVLAGAVSAGAYTAGVLDYLFEALDAWYAARTDTTQPRHNVIIRIMTGASAGGMNAAIAAAVLRRRYPHVHARSGEAVEAANPFYNAWVRAVDIGPMLDTGDLDAGVASLLNCAPLEDIVTNTLAPVPGSASASHDWLVNPLPIILTLTNLRGVPYAVQFHGSGTVNHSMTAHRDYVLFAVEGLSGRPREAPPPDALVLPADMDAEKWKPIGQAALATGAFPIGLRPRVVRRSPGDYNFRNAYFDDVDVKFGPPAWPDGFFDKVKDYAFLSVDGGVMNNEPFDLAHDALAGVVGTNPRDGLDAKRAIIMIDPFVDPAALGPAEDVSLVHSGVSLLTAYKDQARYSPGDWALIQSETVYSRFLVAPSRNDELDGSEALTSGGLGAFLGFFSKEYRNHDFLLGRRNCQWFLKTVFTLPRENPLFATWSDDSKKKYADARDDTHLQIIPVVKSVADEELLPPWPAGKFKLEAPLKAKIQKRMDVVTNGLIKQAFAGWPAWKSLLARAYLWLPKVLVIRPQLFAMVTDAIDAAVASVDARASASLRAKLPAKPPPPPPPVL